MKVQSLQSHLLKAACSYHIIKTDAQTDRQWHRNVRISTTYYMIWTTENLTSQAANKGVMFYITHILYCKMINFLILGFLGLFPLFSLYINKCTAFPNKKEWTTQS